MRKTLTMLCAIALVAAGCGGEGAEDTTADTGPATTAAPTTTAAPATTAAPDTTAAPATTAAPDTTAGATDHTVTVAESELGTILVDENGMTLYLFVPDDGGESTCYDECAANWPAFAGTVEAGDGVDTALLGSTERTDGATQATYNGWPLYYFAGDASPGDTAGQGLNDVWFAVDAEGNAVEG